MKRYLPTTVKLWASAGLLVVMAILIFGKSHLWIGVAGAIYATICTLLLWVMAESTSEVDAFGRPITVEDRFDQLERLKRRDMITADEYAAKRKQILKDL
jgi:hypothetical protein